MTVESSETFPPEPDVEPVCENNRKLLAHELEVILWMPCKRVETIDSHNQALYNRD